MMSEDLENEEIDDEGRNLDIEKLIDSVLNSPVVSEYISKHFESKNILLNIQKEKVTQDLEKQKEGNRFWTFRYWQDILITGIILSAFCVLALFRILDSNIVGTLLGGVMGYSLNRLKKES
jgi:hypothetical protein